MFFWVKIKLFNIFAMNKLNRTIYFGTKLKCVNIFRLQINILNFLLLYIIFYFQIFNRTYPNHRRFSTIETEPKESKNMQVVHLFKSLFNLSISRKNLFRIKHPYVRCIFSCVNAETNNNNELCISGGNIYSDPDNWESLKNAELYKKGLSTTESIQRE